MIQAIVSEVIHDPQHLPALSQQREASRACALLNRLRELGRPQSSPVS